MKIPRKLPLKAETECGSVMRENLQKKSKQVAEVMAASATARTVAEHGSFNRICQVAPISYKVP